MIDFFAKIGKKIDFCFYFVTKSRFVTKIGWATDLKTASQEMINKRAERTGDGTHKPPNVGSHNNSVMVEKFSDHSRIFGWSKTRWKFFLLSGKTFYFFQMTKKWRMKIKKLSKFYTNTTIKFTRLLKQRETKNVIVLFFDATTSVILTFTVGHDRILSQFWLKSLFCVVNNLRLWRLNKTKGFNFNFLIFWYQSSCFHNFCCNRLMNKIKTTLNLFNQKQI